MGDTMSKMGEINVNVDTLAVRADRLDSLTDGTKQCIERLELLSGELSSVWCGEAADALRREIDEEIDMAKSIVKQMDMTSADLKSVAGIYRENEENIERLLKVLDNGGY